MSVPNWAVIFLLVVKCLVAQSNVLSPDSKEDANCSTEATCTPIENNPINCLGTKQNVSAVSFSLTGFRTIWNTQKKLDGWLWIKGYAPDCWSAIQPLLCSVHMPKCENGKTWPYSMIVALSFIHKLFKSLVTKA